MVSKMGLGSTLNGEIYRAFRQEGWDPMDTFQPWKMLSLCIRQWLQNPEEQFSFESIQKKVLNFVPELVKYFSSGFTLEKLPGYLSKLSCEYRAVL